MQLALVDRNDIDRSLFDRMAGKLCDTRQWSILWFFTAVAFSW